jgi:hypothetical protein
VAGAAIEGVIMTVDATDEVLSGPRFSGVWLDSATLKEEME